MGFLKSKICLYNLLSKPFSSLNFESFTFLLQIELLSTNRIAALQNRPAGVVIGRKMSECFLLYLLNLYLLHGFSYHERILFIFCSQQYPC